MRTSDERREAAARLRDARRKCESRGYPWMTDDLILAIGYEHDYEADNGIFDRLADLIEPEEEDTCCDVSDDESVFECSRCGCAVRLCSAEADVFESVSYGPTITMPNGRGGELSFCPCCGARVASSDGE